MVDAARGERTSGVGGALQVGLLRGGLLAGATWVAIGAVPALLLLPAATAAGALERWAALGRRRAVAVGLLAWPLTAALVLLSPLEGIYLRESLSGGGPPAAGRLVVEAAAALPADPDPARLPAAREWLVGLPWWHSSDDSTWCLLAMATLVATILSGLVVARLALGIGAVAAEAPSDGSVELQARFPALVTLASTVGSCALGLVWSAWLLPAPRPGEPGLQGLTLWGFAVLLGMAAPLAYGASDLLLPARPREA